MEDAAELEFAASKLTIVATRVDGDIDNPAYICKVDTESADVWPICRRLSAFAALKETLTEHGNPAVGAIRFPKQPPKLAPLKMLGGLFQQQAPDETVTERREVRPLLSLSLLCTCTRERSSRRRLCHATCADARAPVNIVLGCRGQILEAWCNEVLAVCPGDKEVSAKSDSRRVAALLLS
eukprot:SAG31_NODE_1398_length_8501_cov_5.407046_2_plen_181_part_00